MLIHIYALASIYFYLLGFTYGKSESWKCIRCAATNITAEAIVLIIIIIIIIIISSSSRSSSRSRSIIYSE